MSKMSQLNAELTEQAAELGFETIDEAEANGYVVKINLNGGASLEPDVDRAYKEKEEEEKRNKEAKQLEMVYECLGKAKDMIALIYKPEDEKYGNPIRDIKDKEIQKFYYDINEMCCKLADRNAMIWQKEENESQGKEN